MSDIVDRLLDTTDRDRIDDAIQEITALRAEVERLREALREIVIHCDWPDRVEKYARAALKEDGE